jgi:hypothetical protein
VQRQTERQRGGGGGNRDDHEHCLDRASPETTDDESYEEQHAAHC